VLLYGLIPSSAQNLLFSFLSLSELDGGGPAATTATTTTAAAPAAALFEMMVATIIVHIVH
jgi:hypothetical protein